MWNLVLYDGACWIANAKMPNPGNSDLSVPVTSNIQSVQMIDGSRIYVSPNVKYLNSSINFEITEASSTQTVYSQLENYCKNSYKIDITTHTGEVLSGYISNITKVYCLMGMPQRYRISIQFERV